jgi:hypothetical protein
MVLPKKNSLMNRAFGRIDDSSTLFRAGYSPIEKNSTCALGITL